jgi:hypothetical protein
MSMRQATGKLLLGMAGALAGLVIVLAVPALGRSERRLTVAAHRATASIRSARAQPAAETSLGSSLDPSLTSTSLSPGDLAAPAASDPGGPFWDIKGSALESGEKSQLSTGTIFKLHTGLATVECSEESGTGKVIGNNPGVDEATITFKGCHEEGQTACVADHGEIKTEAYTLLTYPKGEKEKEAKAFDAFLPKPETNNFANVKFEGTACGLLNNQEVPSDAVGTEIEIPHFAIKRKCGILAEVGSVKEGVFAVGKAKELKTEGALNFPTTAISEAEYWSGTEFKVISCKLESGIAGVATQSGLSKVTLSPAEEFGWEALASQAPVPTVTGLQPHAGAASGGYAVTVTGTNFTGATAVKFGPTAATSFEVKSETQISAVVPACSGAVEVTVTTPSGTSAANPPGDVFTCTPVFSTSIGLSFPPTDVAVNSEGDTWVSSWEAGTVEELKENGELIRSITTLASPCSGRLEGPYGLALDSAGNLWVADLLDGVVRKFSATGTCELQFGVGGAPRGIGVDPHGNIWVSGTAAGCVQEFTSAGVSERTVGCRLGLGGGAWTAPGGLAAAANGHIWVADIANSRVIELGEAGEYLGQIGNTTNCGPVLCVPWTVATDAGGHIFVSSASRIDEFSEGGELLARMGGFGSSAGQMEFPLGLAVGSNGTMWAADTGDGRLDKWTGD